MALTDRQIALIRESFTALRDDPKPKSLDFYEAFFARAPELREMFRTDDLAGQGMRFMSTLGMIVDNLEHPGALAERFADLGNAHRAMGVKADHFAPMGAALNDTMAQTLGDGFTQEAREAWEAAFAQVSQEIIDRGGIPGK